MGYTHEFRRSISVPLNVFHLMSLSAQLSLQYDGKYSRPCVGQFDLSACSHYFFGWNLFFGGWTLSHTRCSGEIAATRRLRGKAFFTKVLTEWTDAPGNISTEKVRKGVRDADTKEEEEGTRGLRDDAFYWHTEPEERGEEYWWAVSANSWALRGRLPATRLLQTPGFSKFPAHKLPPSRSDCLVHTNILSRRPTDRWMEGWIR